MSGHEGGSGHIDAELGLQHPHHRQAHGHQRRLGVLGEGEVLGRPLAHQQEQLLGEGVVDFLEHFPRRAEGLRQVGAHAHGLATLAREGEG